MRKLKSWPGRYVGKIQCVICHTTHGTLCNLGHGFSNDVKVCKHHKDALEAGCELTDETKSFKVQLVNGELKFEKLTKEKEEEKANDDENKV